MKKKVFNALIAECRDETIKAYEQGACDKETIAGFFLVKLFSNMWAFNMGNGLTCEQCNFASLFAYYGLINDDGSINANWINYAKEIREFRERAKGREKEDEIKRFQDARYGS